jgi:nucleolar protein 58
MAPLFILAETSAGYALFKSSDKKLLDRSDLFDFSTSVAETCETLKLKKWAKWENAASALNEASAIGEGKVTPLLASLLETLKDEKKASLAVADPKLGYAIAQLPGLKLKPVSDAKTLDVYRAIREHISSLIPDLAPSKLSTTSLGLSHSLSRHKLKFSPDKVDTMIIQAISLLDDLDKELNTYAMRVREWYGWHFPEMAKIVNDNLAYSRTILKTGMRSNASTCDLSDILPEEIEGAVKAAAEISMGTEITDEDLETIKSLAEQVVELTEFRVILSSYLTSRMQAIAPNLTAIVGELVGARLISHAGSLTNLAKSPASTIQILGAEKALFRALKTKHDTPKYGLIYHASLIGQANGKNKGKMARMLAAKAALSLRIDSLDPGKDAQGDDLPEDERAASGTNYRRYLERRLQTLEGRPITGASTNFAPTQQLSTPGKFNVKEARKYNKNADGFVESSSQAVAGAMEIDTPNGRAKDDDSESDSDSDDEAPAPAPATNGTSKLSKEEKKALAKAAKKAQKAGSSEADAKSKRKEEKAARKAEKAAKKAAKAAKKQSKVDSADDDAVSKKRKRIEGEGEAEGKKKKKKAKD